MQKDFIDGNISIVLPYPPSVNSYYSHTRNGVFIGKKGREYSELVADVCNQQLGGMCKSLPIKDNILLGVILYPPDRRKRDLDNPMKGLLDSLTRFGMWEDDSQIDQLLIYRGEVVKGGRCIINLNPAGPVINNNNQSIDVIF